MPAGRRNLSLLLHLFLVASLSGCLSASPDLNVARTITPEAEAVVLEQPKVVRQAQPEVVIPASAPVLSKPIFSELYVNPVPENARVRVMNIKPVFVQGMKLLSGRYHVEVTAPGYQPSLQWVTLEPGKLQRLIVELTPQ